MTLANEGHHLHGSVNIVRSVDNTVVGSVKFQQDGITGCRRKGLFGLAEERKFDLFNEAVLWVEATRNIPCSATSFLRSEKDGMEPGIVHLFDLPDGRFIGVCKFGRAAPAIYPLPRDSLLANGPRIVKTERTWSVYDRKMFRGRRNTVETAILYLATIAAPAELSGHEQMAWRHAVHDMEVRMGRDGLPFDPDRIARRKQNDHY